MINMEVTLNDKEIKEFYELCARERISPAQKIGDLVHGFILAEGVKHQIAKAG